jgi:hypothetical protein
VRLVRRSEIERMTTTPGATRLRPFLGLPALVLFGITFVGLTAPFPMFGMIPFIGNGRQTASCA